MLGFLLALTLGLTDQSVLVIPLQPDPKSIWQEALHQCENPDNIPWIIDSNGLRSYGRYQWQARSWINYRKQGATKENISDNKTQDIVTRYVLDHGGKDNWYTCSRTVEKTLGKYPVSF